MTRITGRTILRTPCCGLFVGTPSYESINMMAFEHWTDGRKVGGLMSEECGLRECSCGSFYLIGDCDKVMTLARPKPIAPEGWQAIKSNWWTRLLGKPTKADILMHYDTRPVDVIDAENLRVPDARPVADSMMPSVFKQQKANASILIVARRRYWRYLNDPFRDIYREHRKSFGEAFPRYQPSDEQADNMLELIQLLQMPHCSNWIELAELYRELGDFSASMDALATYRGSDKSLNLLIRYLIEFSILAPTRYRP